MYIHVENLFWVTIFMSMKAMVMPENVPRKFGLWIQNITFHDISSNQEETYIFENKVIT